MFEARCMWMRGGTSKGGYFLAEDLPPGQAQRDAFLLSMMGSPDMRQIDGMGGASPLTSKVAVVAPSSRPGADVDYLFLQVFVDQALVSDAQNCGNILAGVGPFAIERGLVSAAEGSTDVRVYMENTGQYATASVATPGGRVSYRGDARIDGVPGTAAAVPLRFADTAGSSCGALLPTGNVCDHIDDVAVCCIDNGMPTIVLPAAQLGISGEESCEQLEADQALRQRLERIRLQGGPMMNLGDVREKSVPKLSLVSAARHGGAISTRTFIPHRCHASIGVLGAVSVASACVLPGSPAQPLAVVGSGSELQLEIEHPSGATSVVLQRDGEGNIVSSGLLRTARKLFDGVVFGELEQPKAST